MLFFLLKSSFIFCEEINFYNIKKVEVIENLHENLITEIKESKNYKDLGFFLTFIESEDMKNYLDIYNYSNITNDYFLAFITEIIFNFFSYELLPQLKNYINEDFSDYTKYYNKENVLMKSCFFTYFNLRNKNFFYFKSLFLNDFIKFIIFSVKIQQDENQIQKVFDQILLSFTYGASFVLIYIDDKIDLLIEKINYKLDSNFRNILILNTGKNSFEKYLSAKAIVIDDCFRFDISNIKIAIENINANKSEIINVNVKEFKFRKSNI